MAALIGSYVMLCSANMYFKLIIFAVLVGIRSRVVHAYNSYTIDDVVIVNFFKLIPTIRLMFFKKLY